MTFMIILLVVGIAATVLFEVLCHKISEDFGWDSFTSLIVSLIIAGALIGLCMNAHRNKTVYQSHLENPTQYTYEQLAEHNAEVTEHRAWQGTIFSFYNGTDLSNVDIDSVSRKIIVEE